MLCGTAQVVASGLLRNWIFQASFKGDSEKERHRNPGGGNKGTSDLHKVYFRGNVQPASVENTELPTGVKNRDRQKKM